VDVRTGTLTPSQAARRERMLAAALELALEGGWDAVQMREVAARADVALGTLYRYFQSKEYLLVSVMLDLVEDMAELLTVSPAEGGDPVERVADVLARCNQVLENEPELTTAVIRALVSGNTEIAPVVLQVREEMRGMISDALGDIPHDEDDVLAIDLLSDVWLAVLVSWISGTEPQSAVVPRLRAATRVLLG
jgi:AcrR family transcriptional regulator